jgi:hypothetical protein
MLLYFEGLREEADRTCDWEMSEYGGQNKSEGYHKTRIEGTPNPKTKAM